MIRHIALFKLKPGYTCDHPSVAHAERLASRMGQEIDFLSSWHFGRNISERPAAFDFAGVGLLYSEKDLARYLSDPFHQEVASAWRIVSDWVTADIDEG